MTKEATMYKFEPGYTILERRTLSLTIRFGGTLTILPYHYYHPKYKLPGEHQGNLELDDQGDSNVQV